MFYVYWLGQITGGTTPMNCNWVYIDIIVYFFLQFMWVVPTVVKLPWWCWHCHPNTSLWALSEHSHCHSLTQILSKNHWSDNKKTNTNWSSGNNRYESWILDNIYWTVRSIFYFNNNYINVQIKVINCNVNMWLTTYTYRYFNFIYIVPYNIIK